MKKPGKRGNAQTNGLSKKKSPVRSSGKKSIKGEEERPFLIIGVGASAGGLNAIMELVSQLEPGLNAAILIVLHLSKTGMGDILGDRIARHATLPCKVAEDGDDVLPGHIYIAPSDVHLLVKNDRIILGYGPPENRFRPSIDILFRSIAANYAGRGVGIILTGFLHDGTSGMAAIRQSHGYCIVQDPNEAEYPDMPLSVLDTMEVDECIPISRMPGVLSRVTRERKIPATEAPPEIIIESEISERSAISLDRMPELGEKTIFACPDCGGGLWDLKAGTVDHYKCHVGHSYSTDDLVVKQGQVIEQTLWVALRMMEERRMFLAKLVGENNRKGLKKLAGIYMESAAGIEKHIQELKQLLFVIRKESPADKDLSKGVKNAE